MADMTAQSFSIDGIVEYTDGSAHPYDLDASEDNPIPPPFAPTGVNGIAQSTSSILVSWNDISGIESGYIVERSLDNDNWSQIYDSAAANVESYLDTSLSADTDYYYQVKSYGAGGVNDTNGFIQTGVVRTHSAAASWDSSPAPIGTQGTAGSYDLINHVSGDGPFTFAVNTGSFPAWLTLSSTNGHTNNVINWSAAGDGDVTGISMDATASSGGAATSSVFTVNLGVAGSTVAQLSATKITGVAPLATLFSALGTTSTYEPEHGLEYEFDFGEIAANGAYNENWDIHSHSANEFLAKLSRDKYIGAPIAGHIYETPGTYTAQVKAIEPGGSFSTRTIEIVVTDPDVVFAGTNTICYSNGSDFTGAPAGADLRPNISSFTSVCNAAISGKRVLLKGGDSFSGSGSFTPNSDAILGTFGTGRATVTGSNNTMLDFYGTNGRVLNIYFSSSMASYSSGTNRILNNSAPTAGFLFFGCKTNNGAGHFTMADGSQTDRRGVSICHHEFGRVATRTDGSEGNKHIEGHLKDSLYMGNSYGDNTASFSTRIYSNDHCVFTFNNWHGSQAATKAMIRYQAGGNTGGGSIPTEYFVHGYNAYTGNTFNAGQSKPPSQSFYNVIQNYWIEGNYFKDVNGWVCFGQNFSFRNNIGKTSGTSNGKSLVEITRYELNNGTNEGYSSQFPCANAMVHHNSLYVTGSGDIVPPIWGDRSASEGILPTGALQASDNCVWGPAVTENQAVVDCTGGNTGGNNVLYKSGDTNPLLVSAPTNVLDFQRTAATISADQGANLRAVAGWSA